MGCPIKHFPPVTIIPWSSAFPWVILSRHQGLVFGGRNSSHRYFAAPEVMVIKDSFPIENQVALERCISISHQWRVWHQPSWNLFVWEAKSKARSFSLLCWRRPQISPLQVASCQWLPNMLWSGPCSRNYPVTLIASSVVNQLFFSPVSRSPKCWGLVLLQRNLFPSTTVLHPSLLPDFLISYTSPRVCEI